MFFILTGKIFYHNKRAASSVPMSLAESDYTTTAIMPTGFTTNPPVGTVKPLSVVIQQTAEFIVGFFNFLSSFFQAQPAPQ